MTDTKVANHAKRAPRVAGVVAVVACGAACSLPVLGGLVAGSFLDRVLDPPFLVPLLVCVTLVSAIVMVSRRSRRRASESCGVHGC